MIKVKINRITFLKWMAILFIVAAVLILVFQLIHYSQLRSGFPPGTRIADVPVGGLNQQQSADRVSQAYSIPITLKYGQDEFQLKPSAVGFSINIDAMIAAADQQRTNVPFWSSFWDYLWNRVQPAGNTPLKATIEEKRLRLYLLSEVASRYDKPPVSSQPIPGSVNFLQGKPGEVLDIDRSIPVIENALNSPTQRTAVLPVTNTNPPQPSLENLKVLIKQIIDRTNFDGLTDIYILNLENQKEMTLAYDQGKEYPSGIAFSAASTIKIPIMVSIFKTLPEPLPQNASDLLQGMIEKSANDQADQLMQTYLDKNLGPKILTENTIKPLGLQNTFMAGYFKLGSHLLIRYSTPANTRTDFNTSPDSYDQTTVIDMGMLLDDIYLCAKTGGGTFAAVFPDQITQTECQMMITLLTEDKIGQFLQAGLPDGTRFAHKHGWVAETTDGLLHSIEDAGIVFSPGGDYVIVLSMYQPTQLIFDVANQLAAKISTAVYNYFNITG